MSIEPPGKTLIRTDKVLFTMGMQHKQKVWLLAQDVARKGPLADPRRLGAIPFHIRNHRKIIPTLMHGKRITFGDNISEKGGNRTRRSFIPNVVYRSLHSRSLNMNIWLRLSTTALREIDAHGGLDEYMMVVGDAKIECEVAKMYRKKIAEALSKQKGQVIAGELEQSLSSKYGAEYMSKLQTYNTRLEHFIQKAQGSTASAKINLLTK
ncbi:hypothetical protein DFS34DRAFT_601483 [Phlyctochytrium arcticum]|nr:hypothetical protein DFS34DRAFT_601483 [Phlyctochytrium arcticum]